MHHTRDEALNLATVAVERNVPILFIHAPGTGILTSLVERYEGDGKNFVDLNMYDEDWVGKDGNMFFKIAADSDIVMILSGSFKSPLANAKLFEFLQDKPETAKVVALVNQCDFDNLPTPLVSRFLTVVIK